MSQLIRSQELEDFMLRLDRVSPPGSWCNGFDLAVAAAALEAHLDFIAGLDLAGASPGLQARLRNTIRPLRMEVQRFRSCLLRLWDPRTLSLSSKNRHETFECARKAYGRALEHGRVLISLLIPSMTGWYDATLGR